MVSLFSDYFGSGFPFFLSWYTSISSINLDYREEKEKKQRGWGGEDKSQCLRKEMYKNNILIF
jgi:hypothetical protein